MSAFGPTWGHFRQVFEVKAECTVCKKAVVTDSKLTGVYEPSFILRSVARTLGLEQTYLAATAQCPFCSESSVNIDHVRLCGSTKFSCPNRCGARLDVTQAAALKSHDAACTGHTCSQCLTTGLTQAELETHRSWENQYNRRNGPKSSLKKVAEDLQDYPILHTVTVVQPLVLVNELVVQRVAAANTLLDNDGTMTWDARTQHNRAVADLRKVEQGLRAVKNWLEGTAELNAAVPRLPPLELADRQA